MDAATDRNYLSPFLKRFPATSSSDLGSKRRKRIKADEGNGYSFSSYGSFPASWRFAFDKKRQVLNESDPFTTKDLLNQLDSGKFGSVTKEIEDLIKRRRRVLDSFYALNPELSSTICLDVQDKVASKPMEVAPDVIDLDDDKDDELERLVPESQLSHHAAPVVIIDSDDDNDATTGHLEVDLKPPSLDLVIRDKPSGAGNLLMKDYVDRSSSGKSKNSQEAGVQMYITGEAEIGFTKDKGEYVGTDDLEESDELSDTNSDGLDNIWKEMTFALEGSKDAPGVVLHDEYDVGEEEDCEHSFIFKDDIGDVCRICGVIKRGIETIIEYNFSKTTRTTRTYRYEGRTTREYEQTDIPIDGFKLSDGDPGVAEIHPHPRHRKEMKPHQTEGFNFLLSNLVSDNPGGCILAHAPGSGKTFMIISFLQSFMAKYPAARPLVVLPRGILSIWKKEFLRWQVEEIPLLDFYSAKAEGRAQQLEILKEWVSKRSILFLGYKQFSSIICDTGSGQVATDCINYLLKVPSILILDEGHTPRNPETDILTSLERIETPRKVVLSGTLYQNHVQEVFNILNLVRPKFLKMDTSKAIRRRILSRAEIGGRMKHGRDNGFYDLIEHTLIKDENQSRKVTVIQDLREMTRRVLHYYKGDNLDELPGLVDFSVYLQLSPRQKADIKELKKVSFRKFSICAQGSAIYLHPILKTLAKNPLVKDRVDETKMDAILENLNVKEGAKLNFYMNLLQLCESSGEKLLVFSQFLLPLKFLERITSKVKGYSIGKEMFMITGDSDAGTRESSMEKFNSSSEARVFFGSIKACGEGISLVGASRIIILDVHLNPSVTRQAIGRAFRPGQLKKVYTYRLIASDSPEQEDHATCFKKESISKLWFEWDESSGQQNFEMEEVDDISNCGDTFLETARLREDIVKVYRK
ncbi:protein CHROMATIN REMODELING 35-like isoform X2 [Salvia miltiorrhiza]|uniref:protein CHROMATIN REMODELING 35-like isoform X2 n=1 Tax=Salvia miltiorrhiza TaxID=226208 RepID=UPI0025AC2A98|nr:protein CHROMATIN REMODELING 35-like isoform X2 [Salvia miltiorrhiza]